MMSIKGNFKILIRIYLLNNLVIARNRSACFGASSALGALGRRFESYRPDSNNPSHRQVSQPVFFIG